jgi:hypothetical protein
MLLSDVQAWQSAEATGQRDLYAWRVVEFARAWAEAMERRLVGRRGALTVSAIAEGALADVRPERNRLDLFQFNLAVSLLAQTWPDGRELLRWYNDVAPTRGLELLREPRPKPGALHFRVASAAVRRRPWWRR